MNRLDGIRATGSQRLSTFASNGDVVIIILNYRPAIREFSIDVEWKDFILRGQRVFTSPNILYQYKEVIPFGIGVTTQELGEPFLINDFSTERCNMYILTPAEVEEVTGFYVNGGA